VWGRGSGNNRGTGRLKGNEAKGAATLGSKCFAGGSRGTGREKLGKTRKHNLVINENNGRHYQVSETQMKGTEGRRGKEDMHNGVSQAEEK